MASTRTERLVAVFGWILAAQGLTLSYATRPRGFALKVSWPEPTIASNRYSPHCATITDYMTPKAMSPEECSRDIAFLNGGGATAQKRALPCHSGWLRMLELQPLGSRLDILAPWTWRRPLS